MNVSGTQVLIDMCSHDRKKSGSTKTQKLILQINFLNIRQDISFVLLWQPIIF
jgi:hypothetical protein